MGPTVAGEAAGGARRRAASCSAIPTQLNAVHVGQAVQPLLKVIHALAPAAGGAPREADERCPPRQLRKYPRDHRQDVPAGRVGFAGARFVRCSMLCTPDFCGRPRYHQLRVGEWPHSDHTSGSCTGTLGPQSVCVRRRASFSRPQQPGSRVERPTASVASHPRWERSEHAGEQGPALLRENSATALPLPCCRRPWLERCPRRCNTSALRACVPCRRCAQDVHNRPGAEPWTCTSSRQENPHSWQLCLILEVPLPQIQTPAEPLDQAPSVCVGRADA